MNASQSPKNSRLGEANMEIINYKIQQSRLSNSYPVCKVGLWFNSLSNPEHGEVNLIEVRV